MGDCIQYMLIKSKSMRTDSTQVKLKNFIKASPLDCKLGLHNIQQNIRYSPVNVVNKVHTCDKHNCETTAVVFSRWELSRQDIYSSKISELIRNPNRNKKYMISA